MNQILNSKTPASEMSNASSGSGHSCKTINTIRHIEEMIKPPPRSHEIEDTNIKLNVKDVSKYEKPYQEFTHCSYDEYLKYDQNEFIKENDYIWKENELYFIINVNKKTNEFTMINLKTNKILKDVYPFYYCKIDGNDPEVLLQCYLNCQKC